MTAATLPKQFVATGYVIENEKTLLVYHKKLRMWVAPGGHIDAHETPEQALMREIAEETGLAVEIVAEKRAPDPADGKVSFLHRPRHVQLENIDGFHQHIDLVYFCRPIGGSIRLAPNEHAAIRWFSATELRSDEITGEVRDTALLALQELA